MESLARRLLEGQPNAIVRYRILRDVLRLPPGRAELETAHLQVLSHPWVKELAQEQLPDGTWGRFHSMDSAVKTHFPTSEIAIRRGLALGLDKDDPVLEQALGFMACVLEGKAAWTDRVEKSEGWPIGVEAITAGTLAQVAPLHPVILPVWEYWVGVAQCSFPGGIYDPAAEWKAHKERRGIGIHYLRSRYVLTLLGALGTQLPATLDHQIVHSLWNDPAGIGYLGADLQHPHPHHIFHWLESMEILSLFQNWRQVAGKAIQWIWEQRNQVDLWDFGAKVSQSFYFPLSDTWQKTGNRCVDHSTRVLALLRQYLVK